MAERDREAESEEEDAELSHASQVPIPMNVYFFKLFNIFDKQFPCKLFEHYVFAPELCCRIKIIDFTRFGFIGIISIAYYYSYYLNSENKSRIIWIFIV